ncbi:MAG: alpha-glucan family phosphorylase [Gammaproteobacteria bacterium]|nr:alpha-glucan family phosphorylase [Gammaproteobacteria bacterium]
MDSKARIAYFSMEIALDARMPTYSGGLGVLAGDTVRTAADLGVPMVAVCLLHRRGYFRQQLASDGTQHEHAEDWQIDALLEPLAARAKVSIASRQVSLRAWHYRIAGCHGHEVSVIFIDSDLPENDAYDRRLTDQLYGGDAYYRLCQEVLLGIGGVRLLRALGFDSITRFHMNEGHAALLTLELLAEACQGNGQNGIGEAEIEAVRAQCVFTTHTPVPAGHDQFALEMAAEVLGKSHAPRLRDLFSTDVYRQVLRTDEAFTSPGELLHRGLMLNMTYLALNLSRYVNGVAHRHGEISRLMFADYRVDAITNGVHAATWIAAPMAQLLDRHLAGWAADNVSLRYALAIPLAEIGEAHTRAKRQLFDHVQTSCGVGLDPQVLTLGFARRATAYKRPDLLFHDMDRLRQIARDHGGLQAVFAGKAHPADAGGKALIRQVHAAAAALRADGVQVVYLPDYDIRLALLLVSGVDVWLNTPLPPNEASGTSGMKAAMNGVPSLSTLDGWWIEGHLEGITGWAIGSGEEDNAADRMLACDARSLYDTLAEVVMPCFYRHPEDFLRIRRNAIALNGAFFNSQRMLQQYLRRAYL